eukprot:2599589-Amphidinium_carterae.1
MRRITFHVAEAHSGHVLYEIGALAPLSHEIPTVGRARYLPNCHLAPLYELLYPQQLAFKVFSLPTVTLTGEDAF